MIEAKIASETETKPETASESESRIQMPITPRDGRSTVRRSRLVDTGSGGDEAPGRWRPVVAAGCSTGGDVA